MSSYCNAIIHCNCFSSLWRFAQFALLIVTLCRRVCLSNSDCDTWMPKKRTTCRSLLLKLLLCSLAILCSILSVPPTNINLKNKSQSKQNFTIHLFVSLVVNSYVLFVHLTFIHSHHVFSRSSGKWARVQRQGSWGLLLEAFWILKARNGFFFAYNHIFQISCCISYVLIA